MFTSSSFRFRKTKKSPRGCYERKLTDRHRFRDVSHIKLSDIFKPLRRRGLRRNVSNRSSLTHSQSLPPPFADHDVLPAPQLPSSDISASPSLQISCYRSDAVNTSGTTEEDCSSGMSASSTGLESIPPDGERACRFPSGCVSSFPTSPSAFQLRSTSTKDYLVERLGQHLCRLSLEDTSLSPDHAVPSKESSCDIQMDVCLTSPNVSPLRTVGTETSSCCSFSDRNAQEPKQPPHDQNLVPMILITSVDAKHAKPLPPTAQRPSRTPFSPSNHVNDPTNAPSAKPNAKKIPDDPFMTQPHGAVNTYPPSYNLTFRLPAFPPFYSSPAKHDPETPTPMCCDHFGDCRSDVWEVLHPPLVAGAFTLPPFKLPSMSSGLFDDVSTPLAC